MKKIALLSVGSELLSGKIVNTNSAYLGRRLSEHGFEVSFGLTLPDEEEAIADAIREALHRVDAVLVTGGLGPTDDDRTLDAALRVFPSPKIRNDQVAEEIASRYGAEVAVRLEQQALVPKNAQVVRNSVGTAPGILFTKGEQSVVLLPGVPHEMKTIFEEELLPLLLQKYPVDGLVHEKRFSLCLLHEGQIDPFLRKLIEEFPSISYGIYPSYGTVRVCLLSPDIEEIEHATALFETEYGEYIFTTGESTIPQLLHGYFIGSGKTLSFAESCTGGHLATEITAIPGCSTYFLGSCVAYANSAKEELLGVKSKTLQDHGAVSREAVSEMLEGIFARTGSDYAIAVSGIAGPTGGSPEKPVGTVWAAIGRRGEKPFIGKLRLRGDRKVITEVSASQVLAHLWLWVGENKEPFSPKRNSYDV